VRIPEKKISKAFYKSYASKAQQAWPFLGLLEKSLLKSRMRQESPL
jgi:hypothetical protein